MRDDAEVALLCVLFAAVFCLGFIVGGKIERIDIYESGAIEYYLDDDNNKQWRPVTQCTGE